jgi:hypothetical protein
MKRAYYKVEPASSAKVCRVTNAVTVFVYADEASVVFLLYGETFSCNHFTEKLLAFFF